MEWQTGKAINPRKEVKKELPENRSSSELTARHKPETIAALNSEKHDTRTLIIGEGQTLRTLALDLFGNKEFWVYIYQENIHNIKNPNVIPAGTELQIPDISRYNIDPDDPKSVDAAKQKGDRILDVL